MGDSTAARLASAPLLVQVQRRARYARAMAGLWPTWLPAHERIRAGTQSKFLRSGRLCGMGRCALADGIRMGGCCLSSEYRSALRPCLAMDTLVLRPLPRFSSDAGCNGQIGRAHV